MTHSEVMQTRNPSQTLHVIFGAGQIGRRLARELLSLGHRVRIVRRGAPGLDEPGLEWMQGDVTDPSFADRAAQGAAVVYNCVNPADYHTWDDVLPPLFDGVRGAATRAEARLVVLDNLYMYGPHDQGHMHERIAMRPSATKGELRKRLAESLFEAHAKGELRVTSGRASDYFGPGGVNTFVSNPRALERMSRGKAVELIGDPNKRHSFNYIPDVARGLAVLGTHPSADGRAWHLPVSWQGTTAGLVRELARRFGQSGKVRALPKWAIRTFGLVSPLMRALVEMTYQWEDDFVLDDADFRHTFGVEPTPVEQAVRETAAWFETTSKRAA